MCGDISSTHGMLQTSDGMRACIEGTYSWSGSNKYVEFQKYDYVCVSYSSATTDQLVHTYLQNCSVQPTTYKCKSDNYYTSSGCIACPTGSAASSSGTHTTTSCNYCTAGYYYNGSSCAKCPTDGDNPVSTGGTAYRPPISRCCLTGPTGTDATGEFEVGSMTCCHD